MIRFLHWLRSIMAAVLNGIAKFVFLILLVVVVLLVIGLAHGDGVPANTVLTLDLRGPIADSTNGPSLPIATRPLTVMDLLFTLDAAAKDARVKGVVVRLGGGSLSTAQAEEIGGEFHRFRSHGKFVIAQATAFFGAGMGDYVTAAAADQIWVQPKSNFDVAGAGVGEVFLRGLFDKIHAEPQIAKREQYKSAADMYMEKTMTGPDREQLTALVNSLYDSAVTAAATDRHLDKKAVMAAFEASPQFAEDAKQKGLIDRTGYDDDALNAALAKAGSGAKAMKFTDYSKPLDFAKPNIAVIEASGEIVDGSAGTSVFDAGAGIASDDMSEAIRQATKDANIKAIVLRVDSPGGSVTASDQILDAVKKAQAKGKPVVVSMAGVAASGGYYISASANKIVAEPGTLTGSIGVLTGKVSVGKALQDWGGVGFDQVSVGKNTLMDSPLTPFTDDQWAALNHEADVIYDDFLHKVAAGRKLPVEQIKSVAGGRVWSGADARTHGLVDQLGGFWTAAGLAAQLGGVAQDQMAYKIYPRRRGLLEGVMTLMDGAGVSMRALGGIQTLMELPAFQSLLGAVHDAPRGGVEMRAVGLTENK